MASRRPPRWLSRLAAYTASTLAIAASPVAIYYVYQAVNRRKAKKQLLEALEGNDPAELLGACAFAEEHQADPDTISKARGKAKRLRAEAKLWETLGGQDAEQILAACGAAEEAGVPCDAAVLCEGYKVIRQLLCEAFRSDDLARIVVACGLAPRVGVADETIVEARSQARKLGEAELQQALDGRDTAALERACSRADSAGVGHAAVAPARGEARRRRAEADLMEALKRGDLGGIERAVHRAELTKVDDALVSQGQAEVGRLQAKAELIDAFRADSAKQLEVACRRAEKAGVDVVLVCEGRSKLARLRESDGLRKAQAEAELSEATRAGDCGRLYAACRSAEAAGVDAEAITKSRGEARRLYDLAEMRGALDAGDLKRAFVASGGSFSIPLER